MHDFINSEYELEIDVLPGNQNGFLCIIMLTLESYVHEQAAREFKKSPLLKFLLMLYHGIDQHSSPNHFQCFESNKADTLVLGILLLIEILWKLRYYMLE